MPIKKWSQASGEDLATDPLSNDHCPLSHLCFGGWDSGTLYSFDSLRIFSKAIASSVMKMLLKKTYDKRSSGNR